MKKIQKENWLNYKIFLLLTFVFIITQLIGIIIANNLILLNIKSTPISGDLNSPLEAIYLICAILVMTIFILVLLKYKKQKKFLIFFEAFAIFAGATIVFGSFFPYDDFLVLLITITILVYRHTHKENILFKNIVSMIAIMGAGALIGISLGIIPVLIFIILLAVYDFIAVFKTKHMVTMGKSIVKEKLAFTITMPTKTHTFELGNGDLVIPLIVSSSILANGFFNNNLLVATLCIISSYIGLVFSIYIVATKKITLPALPPQTILMVLIIIISYFIRL